jgi:hypothetical protein
MSAGRSVELRVLCEGQTERNFVTQVLRPHLAPHRVFASPVGLDKTLTRSNGIVAHGTLRRNIKNEVGRSRAHQWVTTLIDLYALPPDYPGWAKQGSESGVDRAKRIEQGMREALPNQRFLPFVQVHEFEALVLVDVDRIPDVFPDGEAVGVPDLLRKSIGHLEPEEVDDGKTTAPSKRIIAALPAYSAMKAIAGPEIAARIGMAALRAKCPHFHEWLTRLEGLATP